ncbi:AI-2E family transporter [Histidinibacterium aquaticum]|uniref:AI-2E family transporter n=1 Tax=Histidinibacterium aquaticum TaxID=2613962 RepID=A0A5J5GPG8_9RHOB|nr:AI-2E family transporter [Histidinibacterium aquaticum]KAA9010060.1 AI-2E family transporter [Histidinibacterium aquaticum]
MTRPPTPPDLQELRTIRRYVGWLFLIAAGGTLYFARALLLPLVLAILLALTLRPIARGLYRIGVPHVVSAVGLILLLATLVGGATYVASGPATRLMERAPEMGQEVQFKLRHILRSVDEMQDATEQVQEIADGGSEGAQEVVIEQGGLLTDVMGSLASAGTSLAVAIVLAMFLLASGEFFPRRIVEASPRLEDKERSLTIVRGVERQISRYLAAITIINAGLGVAIGLTLWAIGLPNPHLWGIAAFLLNYLPFLGAAAGVIGVGVVALVSFDSVGQALLCPFAYFCLTALEGNIVTPSFVGRQLSINTVAVFVTVILWVWLWGIAGAFLAVPVLLVIKVVSDNVPALKTLGMFLSQDQRSN